MTPDEPKSTTTLDDMCGILADLWMTYRFNSKFDDFVNYNDIGLPLAFLLSEGMVKSSSPLTKSMIEETFGILLGALKVEDSGFESLDDILVDAPDWNG